MEADVVGRERQGDVAGVERGVGPAVAPVGAGEVEQLSSPTPAIRRSRVSSGRPRERGHVEVRRQVAIEGAVDTSAAAAPRARRAHRARRPVPRARRTRRLSGSSAGAGLVRLGPASRLVGRRRPPLDASAGASGRASAATPESWLGHSTASAAGPTSAAAAGAAVSSVSVDGHAMASGIAATGAASSISAGAGSPGTSSAAVGGASAAGGVGSFAGAGCFGGATGFGAAGAALRGSIARPSSTTRARSSATRPGSAGSDARSRSISCSSVRRRSRPSASSRPSARRVDGVRELAVRGLHLGHGVVGVGRLRAAVQGGQRLGAAEQRRLVAWRQADRRRVVAHGVGRSLAAHQRGAGARVRGRALGGDRGGLGVGGERLLEAPAQRRDVAPAERVLVALVQGLAAHLACLSVSRLARRGARPAAPSARGAGSPTGRR